MKYEIEKFEKNVDDAAAFLKGLASPHRLRILCALSEGEKNVTTLIEQTGLAQTSMSQHLGKLKDEGIVDYRRDHRTLYYRICHPLTFNIIGVMHDHFCDNKKGERQ
jgi:ArsR family transcriptional regulator, virulence genes transcriptional regulator